MRYAPRIVPVGLLAATALAACSDTLEAPTAARPSAALPAAAASVLRDDGINRGDTHYSAEVVTTTTIDYGGLSLASTSGSDEPDVERTYVEAGYGVDGSLRFGVWFEDPTRSPTIGSARLAAGYLTLYSRGGAVLSSNSFHNTMESVGLPGGSVEGAMLLDAPPPGDGGCEHDCYAAQSALPEGMTVSETGDVREVVFRPAGVVAAGGRAAETTFRYRRVARGAGRDSLWLLESTERVQPTRRNGRDVTLRSQTRLAYRAYHRNPGRDRARQARAAELRRHAPTATGSPATLHLASAQSAAEAPAVAGPVASGFDIANICAPGEARFERFRNVESNTHILYQHGFCSDASVWYAFDDRLEQTMPIKTSRAYSLDTRQTIEAQVSELRNNIQLKVPTQHIVIGHSAGGLVGRRFGQRYPDLVRGVVTIGTPHLGSLLADVGPASAAEQLRNALRVECYLQEVCNLVSDILRDMDAAAPVLGVGDFVPSVDDYRTNSSFGQILNSTHEEFPRVSIETTPRKRWVLARLLGDRTSSSARLLLGARPVGDARVTEVERVYAIALWANRAAQSFLWYSALDLTRNTICDRQGFSFTWPTCTGEHTRYEWFSETMQMIIAYVTYTATGAAMDLMNQIDRTWDHLTTRRQDQTDGLIHRTSQRYPDTPGSSLPRRLAISGATADSHAGQTKSPPVFAAVLEAIGIFERGTRR